MAEKHIEITSDNPQSPSVSKPGDERSGNLSTRPEPAESEVIIIQQLSPLPENITPPPEEIEIGAEHDESSSEDHDGNLPVEFSQNSHKSNEFSVENDHLFAQSVMQEEMELLEQTTDLGDVKTDSHSSGRSSSASEAEDVSEAENPIAPEAESAADFLDMDIEFGDEESDKLLCSNEPSTSGSPYPGGSPPPGPAPAVPPIEDEGVEMQFQESNSNDVQDSLPAEEEFAYEEPLDESACDTPPCAPGPSRVSHDCVHGCELCGQRGNETGAGGETGKPVGELSLSFRPWCQRTLNFGGPNGVKRVLAIRKPIQCVTDSQLVIMLLEKLYPRRPDEPRDVLSRDESEKLIKELSSTSELSELRSCRAESSENSQRVSAPGPSGAFHSMDLISPGEESSHHGDSVRYASSHCAEASTSGWEANISPGQMKQDPMCAELTCELGEERASKTENKAPKQAHNGPTDVPMQTSANSLSAQSEERSNGASQLARFIFVRDRITALVRKISAELDALSMEEKYTLMQEALNSPFHFSFAPFYYDNISDQRGDYPEKKGVVPKERQRPDASLAQLVRHAIITSDRLGGLDLDLRYVTTLLYKWLREALDKYSENVATVCTLMQAAKLELPPFGDSSCGAVALGHVLMVLNWKNGDWKKPDLNAYVPTHLRANTAPLADYLLSRSVAGTTHLELIAAIEDFTGGTVSGRFFPGIYFARSDPDTSEVRTSLCSFLAPMIRAGAVPMMTLNMQRSTARRLEQSALERLVLRYNCVFPPKEDEEFPDAWHHQMVCGVAQDSLDLVYPVERLREEFVQYLISGDRVLAVCASDVLNRWNLSPSRQQRSLKAISELSKTDSRWTELNVIGQVLSLIRQAASPAVDYDPISHIIIPAAYHAGVTLFAKTDGTSPVWDRIMTEAHKCEQWMSTGSNTKSDGNSHIFNSNSHNIPSEFLPGVNLNGSSDWPESGVKVDRSAVAVEPSGTLAGGSACTTAGSHLDGNSGRVKLDGNWACSPSGSRLDGNSVKSDGTFQTGSEPLESTVEIFMHSDHEDGTE